MVIIPWKKINLEKKGHKDEHKKIDQTKKTGKVIKVSTPARRDH